MTRLLVLGLSLLCVLGCEETEEVEAEPETPGVGVMELPISFRHDGSGPPSPMNIEVTPSELRVDGTSVVGLEGGRVPDAERAGNLITKLATNIRTGPARRAASMRVHASTPYLTTALIFSTLKEANIHEAAFEVRQGSGTEVGYLKLARFDVREETEEWATFPASHQRNWDELAPHWEAMTTACRENHSVDCAYKPENIAEGGQLQLTLFARGNAVKIEMNRFGGEDPEPAGNNGPALIEGIAPAPAAQEEEAPPATDAVFTWRFQATTSEPSPVSNTLRELCGAQGCGAVVTAEGQTSTMRIVSFLGAAFPNGSPAPQIMFQIPPR
ncbi:MAG: hypothetical protein AAGE52_35540 [Myxococcota bacterium]